MAHFLGSISQAGGWRGFLKVPAAEWSDQLAGIETSELAGATDLILARAFVLAKCGRSRDARAIIDQLVATSSGPHNPHAPDIVLVDAHVRAYEDRALSNEDVEKLHQALDALPDNDPIGQALALNQLCTSFLHAGYLDKAQEFAESAIRLYRLGGAEFGSLHLHTHLGEIRLLRGDLFGAKEIYSEMETRLRRLPDASDNLLAVGDAFRSEIAYEMNNLQECSQLLDDSMRRIEANDAWLDVRAAAYRTRIRLSFAQYGLPRALAEIAHASKVASARNMQRLRRLMEVERIRVLTLSNELDAALAEMRRLGVSPESGISDDVGEWALRHSSTVVAIARWLVWAGRPRQALEYIGSIEDFTIRGGQLLSLAKMRVLQGAAHWSLQHKSDATRSLLSAMRLLRQQPFRRFILDEGRKTAEIVQAALDGDHVTVPPGPGLRRRLSELNYYWATRSEAPDPDRARSQTGGSGPDIDEQRRTKYLKLLERGYSNKEIGRLMGVSVDTVKYHLKSIFRELKVNNRQRAVHRARELNILGS
jgi:ATP/maltotriose-dependent transcriptional regulator MalT